MNDFRSLWPWRGPMTLGSKRGSLAEMRAIATDTAERHGLALGELFSRYGKFSTIHCRQEAMAAMYATERFSLPRIGWFFGRDHTTVLYAVRAVERRAAAASVALPTPAPTDGHIEALAPALAQREAA